MFDSSDNKISTNFYWLSTEEEILDYEADLGEFAYHTPSKQYADLKLLDSLPKVDVVFESHHTMQGEEQSIIAELKNAGEAIAFLINLNIVDKESGEAILPVFWEDNFISLLPGEKRSLKATFKSTGNPVLKVDGWNIKTVNHAEISDSRREALS